MRIRAPYRTWLYQFGVFTGKEETWIVYTDRQIEPREMDRVMSLIAGSNDLLQWYKPLLTGRLSIVAFKDHTDPDSKEKCINLSRKGWLYRTIIRLTYGRSFYGTPCK